MALIEPLIKNSTCNTRHPVVLVSGLGFTEEHFLLNYWGAIPDHLRQQGCTVYTGKQDAFSSHVDNAKKLKERILRILDQTDSEKVNIIGHSKGGIEARYMISRLEMDDCVASLTTLGSPHHGSGLADIIVGRSAVGRVAAARVINIVARIMGDKNPDSLRAGFQVSKRAMAKFNDEVPDSSRVYYQSWASHVRRDYPNPLWKTLAGILMITDGSNDGLVSIESAKWGNYKGIISSPSAPSVSHADMVGLTQFTGVFGFNARQFIGEVVEDLKERGF